MNKFKLGDCVSYYDPISKSKVLCTIIAVLKIEKCYAENLNGEYLYKIDRGQSFYNEDILEKCLTLEEK